MFLAVDHNFNLGRHEALIETLGADMKTLMSDVADIKNTLAEERGARRFKAGAWGVAGGILSAVVGALFKGHFGLHS